MLRSAGSGRDPREPALECRSRHDAVLEREQGEQRQIDGQTFEERPDWPGIERTRHAKLPMKPRRKGRLRRTRVAHDAVEKDGDAFDTC